MQMGLPVIIVALAKPRIPIVIAILAMAVLWLSGCSKTSESPGSESPGMNNPTGTSAALDDPTGAIAELDFYSAEDDAIYQCLLSAATSSATTRGLQAVPVIKQERPEHPIYQVGVYANWCKTVGTGDVVDRDNAFCRNLTGRFSAPGTEVLQLLAAPVIGSAIGIGDKIDQIELKSIKIPEQGNTDFKVDFLRIRGRDKNFFSLNFVPYDGNIYNEELSLSIRRNYHYTDQDINLSESYIPNETVAEHMNLLSSSTIQFKTTATSHFEILRSQVELAINADSSLDGNAKQVALDKATTEFDRRINLIDQNSETLHRQLLEQFAVEECG